MGRRQVRWGVGAPREGSEGDGEACPLILSHHLSLGSVVRRLLRASQVPRVVEPIFQVGPLRPSLAEVAGPQALRLKAAARDLELSLDWAGHEGCWTGGVLWAQQRARWAAVSGRSHSSACSERRGLGPLPGPRRDPAPEAEAGEGARGGLGPPLRASAPPRAAHSRGSGLAALDARRPGGLTDRRPDVRSAPR